MIVGGGIPNNQQGQEACAHKNGAFYAMPVRESQPFGMATVD